MELKQLRYFAAIISHDSYRQAAQSLGTVESNLSIQMKHLEKELGTKLLVREGRTMRPTAAGLELYRHTKLILQQAQIISRAIPSVRENPSSRQTIHIGISGNYLTPLIVQAGKHLRQQFLFEFTQLDTHQILTQLKNNQLDLAITPLARSITQDPLLEFTFLFTDKTVALIPKKWSKLAQKKQITFAELFLNPLVALKQQFVVRQHLDEYFLQNHLQANIEYEVNDYSACLAIVQQNEIAGMVTKYFMQQQSPQKQLQVIPIISQILPIQMGIVSLKQPNLEIPVNQLKTALYEECLAIK